MVYPWVNAIPAGNEIDWRDWVMVQVVTQLELGGAQLLTLALAQQLGNVGHQHLVCGHGGMLDDEVDALADLHVHRIPGLGRALSPRKDLSALLQLGAVFRKIRRMSGDRKILVHTHSSKAGILGRLAARWAGIDRIVHSVHGFGHGNHGSKRVQPLLRTAERLAGYCTDGITIDSQDNLRDGRADKLWRADLPCSLISGGFDAEAVEGGRGLGLGVRDALQIDTADKIILNVSCLKPQKDPLTFVEVARRVCAARDDCVFVLAGDGILRPDVAAAAADLGSRFRLLGWRRDIPALLDAADILMLTSLWEGLPQVFGEAMQAGLPIVATRADGASEAIVDGETGFLAPRQDVSALVAATLRLLEQPELMLRMGEEGRARARLYCRQTVLLEVARFYRFVMGSDAACQAMP